MVSSTVRRASGVCGAVVLRMGCPHQAGGYCTDSSPHEDKTLPFTVHPQEKGKWWETFVPTESAGPERMIAGPIAGACCIRLNHSQSL